MDQKGSEPSLEGSQDNNKTAIQDIDKVKQVRRSTIQIFEIKHLMRNLAVASLAFMSISERPNCSYEEDANPFPQADSTPAPHSLDFVSAKLEHIKEYFTLTQETLIFHRELVREKPNFQHLDSELFWEIFKPFDLYNRNLKNPMLNAAYRGRDIATLNFIELDSPEFFSITFTPNYSDRSYYDPTVQMMHFTRNGSIHEYAILMDLVRALREAEVLQSRGEVSSKDMAVHMALELETVNLVTLGKLQKLASQKTPISSISSVHVPLQVVRVDFSQYQNLYQSYMQDPKLNRTNPSPTFIQAVEQYYQEHQEL